MNNVQFYLLLSPAIGSLVLVVLAWLHQNSRLTDLRNDNDRRFGDVNRRFDDLTRRFEDRFDGVDAKLAALTSDYRTFYGMEQKLEGRVEELSKRVA